MLKATPREGLSAGPPFERVWQKKAIAPCSKLAYATTLSTPLNHNLFLYAADPLGREGASKGPPRPCRVPRSPGGSSPQSSAACLFLEYSPPRRVALDRPIAARAAFFDFGFKLIIPANAESGILAEQL
jgi:hypothetical protein